MKLCSTPQCVTSYNNAVVIFERKWRETMCTDVSPDGLGGPGAFVFAIRVSARLSMYALDLVRQWKWCHIEKFLETVCRKYGLGSSTFGFSHHGWLSAEPDALDDRYLAGVNDLATDRQLLFHPYKAKEDPRRLLLDGTVTQASSLDSGSPGPLKAHCQVPSQQYHHPQFAVPAPGNSSWEPCTSGCWVVNSSDPALTCSDFKSTRQQPDNPLAAFFKGLFGFGRR